ncbi:MAG: LacI family transcriptional regulator [Desulfovibrionaceae bacterium CG1_02_65_16]|nr:MAG: LacI family transcriptional regulator [Desulfovibrionaceae bacterium CG1_02_65_16]
MSRDWQTLLAEAVASVGSRAAVARELGVSRTAVSLLLAGAYPGDTAHMAARVIARYDRLLCPHTNREVTPDHCRKFCGQVPTSSPAALRQWRACRACPNNPNANPNHEENAA